MTPADRFWEHVLYLEWKHGWYGWTFSAAWLAAVAILAALFLWGYFQERE